MKGKAFSTVALLAILAGPGWGQNIANQSAPWATISTDTRASAMGGAIVAVTDDTGALEANPAGLGLLSGPLVDLSHCFWIEGLTLEHAAFGDKASDMGYAVEANYFNLGQVQEFSVGPSGPAANGTLNPQAMSLLAGGGIGLGQGFYAGAAAEWLGQELISSWDSAFLANLGALYRSPSGFSAGLAVLNLGQNLDGYSLPLQISTGAAYSVPNVFPTNGSPDSASFSGEWDYYPNSSLSNFGLGCEYWYEQKLALRGGYHFADYGQTDEVHGLTLGIGLKLSKIEFSYAWVTLGTLGISNQFALSFAL